MREASPRGRWFVLAAAVIALVVVMALPASAATVVKLTSTNRYNPGSVSINKGGTIKWRNVSNKKHNIVAYSNNWSYRKTLNAGEVATRRFGSRGTFKYRCTIQSHSNLSGGNCSGMCGVIKVG